MSVFWFFFVCAAVTCTAEVHQSADIPLSLEDSAIQLVNSVRNYSLSSTSVEVLTDTAEDICEDSAVHSQDIGERCIQHHNNTIL